MLTLREMQVIAHSPVTDEARERAVARLAQSVAQSLRAEGYPVTDEESLESLRRVLGR